MKKIYKICSLAVSLMIGVIMVCSFVFAEQSDMNMTFTKILSSDNLSVVINGQVSSDIYEIIGIQEEGKERIDGITTIEATVTENKEYTFTVFYKDKSNAEITDQTQLIEEIPELNQVYTIEVTEIPEKVVLPEEKEIQTQEINEETNISLTADTQEVTEYVFDENTKTITEYTGTSTDVVIPETINNVTVENIGENVFKDKGITSVVFPNTIKKIGNYAFKGHKLTELILPESLEDVGIEGFYGEYGRENGITNLHIPKSVKYLRWQAFADTGIKNLTFSENCHLQMGYGIFLRNYIKSVDLSVGNIILNIPENSDYMDQMDRKGGSIFTDNQIETVKLNRYMTNIPSYTFERNNLKTINIPANIQSIGGYAFYGNKQLESIKLNEGLKKIETSAFIETSLKSVDLPSTIIKLAKRAFDRTALACFEIPEHLIGTPENDDLLTYNLIYSTSIQPKIIKKNNQWILDLKSLDKKFKLDKVEKIYVIEGEIDSKYETIELSSIGGKYERDTGILAFTEDIQDKQIVYEYRMTNNENVKYPMMKVVIKSENIIVHTDVTFDTVDVKDYRMGALYGELPVPTKIGYTFKEWNTSSDGTGETITSDTIVTNENEHTLYPIFTPTSYEVTLIADNYNQVKNVYYDSPYGELPVIEKTGFDFIGWNSQSDGKGKYVTKDAILDKAENQTLYAIYKKSENNSSDNNQTPNGEIILPGEDGKPGTDDDIIVKPATIDDKGNIIIPDGGIIIYPDGSQENFPNGAVIKPGDDGQVGTKDDIIIDSGTVDDQGNITISNGGAIIYPDGKREEFPNGGVIIIDKNGDEIIIKSGQLDNQGNIIISDGGMIIYPDGTRKSFPKGGIINWGKDGKLEIKDLNEVNNQGLIYTEQKNTKTSHYVLTNDNTQLLLWSLIGIISMANAIMSVKKKLRK